jgi:K+-transporting ATPase KdpF subunit
MEFSLSSSSSFSGRAIGIPEPANGCDEMSDILGIIIGLLLIVYMFVSVLRPEKF